MYHFVLLDNRIWYLKPHTEQDILDHFNKVMAREFKLGFEDHKEGTHVINGLYDPSEPEVFLNHPPSPWRTIYLSNNLTFFVPNTNDSPLEIDEAWKEELEYPTDLKILWKQKN